MSVPGGRPPRVLVTGGAGFVGSQYVRALLSGEYPAWAGAEVTVLDRLTYAGDLRNLAPVEGRFRFVHGDVCDAWLLAEVVPGQDAVLNFAAESHVDRSIEGRADEFFRTNVLGVHTLLRACLDAGTPRIVQVSTDEVYGSIDKGSCDESAPLRPSSPYAASKAGGDLAALAYARTYGLPVVVTRCGNTYGPYQFPEKIIPLFVTNLLDGRPVPLYGDGGNIRQWIHVADHCRGVQTAAEHGATGEIYNVAGDMALTNTELTRLLLDALRADASMVEHVADRKGHDRRYAVSGAKLHALGHSNRVPFAAGLAGTIRWYAENREWWEPLKKRVDSAAGGLSRA